VTGRWRAGLRLLALSSVVGVVAVTLTSMPPGAVTLPPAEGIPEPVRGAFHIHSRRSDGTGTLDEIAAAASRAGLKFVVITDHGDATRQPDPPTYRSGVLCIDAVEITTSSGHLVALGLRDRAPYPLGGDPQDVVEDVARLGGMSIAAHPASPKASLRWTDWRPPLDGLEWLNADSEWRDEHAGSLVRAILTYPWRKPETLAALFDRPVEPLRTWDALNSRRRVIALAAADAHANLGMGNDSDDEDRSALPLAIPAYEEVFRTFSVGLPAIRLSGDAVTDAQAVLREIRAGHLYSSIDGLASPGRLHVTASSGSQTAIAGDVLAADGPVAIRAHSNAPAGARISLLSDGREVASADGPTLHYSAPARRAAYRVEVQFPGTTTGQSRVPWLLSNAIYVGGVPEAPASAAAAPADVQMDMVASLSASDWSIEKNEASRAGFDVVSRGNAGTELQLDYALEASTDESPWIAFNLRTPPDLARFSRLVFSARSDRPMRLWVQLRTLLPARRLYWRRSVYIDSTLRQVVLPFAEMRAIEDGARNPPLVHAEVVMFVVDRTHTPVGGEGRVWLHEIGYRR
jgi:hypothetical protein